MSQFDDIDEMAHEGLRQALKCAIAATVERDDVFDEDARANQRSTTAAAMLTIDGGRGVRSGPSEHDVFMESVKTEMAELLSVSEQAGEREPRRVRFVVPGKRRVLRLRVRVITQGDRRVEVCLVSTGALPRGSEPYPIGLRLESWVRASQIFTGFRIPFQTFNHAIIQPIVSSALRHLTHYATLLS
jgi:hypothetical protein